jgi:hypothetical protein
MRAAHDPRFPPLSEFHRELAAAELAGEISEFYALGLQAIIAMGDDSGFADDYLDMAELVAASDAERTTVAEWRRLYAHVQRVPGPCVTPRQTPPRECGSLDDDHLIALRTGLVNMLCELGARVDGDHGSSQAA